jgi:hypothetical protein
LILEGILCPVIFSTVIQALSPYALSYQYKFLVFSSSSRLEEVPAELCGAAPEAGEGRLGDDRLEERCEKLAQQAPGRWPGQAACAQCGESSNSPISGSSSKMTNRCASRYGLAERSSVPGGAFSPIRLLSRLKASSMRHRNR